MFSKKVLEVFRNPKNIGDIKDADGIGRVGNPACGDIMWVYIKVGKNAKGQEVLEDIKVKTFGCLPPNEKVVLWSGWQNIDSIKEKQEVINGDGLRDSVEKRFEIPYEGRMLTFVPLVSPHNTFSVTPEHPLLALRREGVARGETRGGKSKWLRVNKSKLTQVQPEYTKAKELGTGDYLLFNSSKEIQDDKKMSKGLLRLLGYYLAEGYPIARGNAVAFAFHKNEKKPIEEVRQLVREITGKEMGMRTRGNVSEIYVCSKRFVDNLIGLGGKGAKGKALSDKIMKLPPKKQIEVVNTFWIGDGDTTTRRKGNSPTYRLATASQRLAIQFQEILARNGIFSSIAKRKRKSHTIEDRNVTGSPLYIVGYKPERIHKFVHFVNGYFLVPIKQILETDYKGLVYNLHMAKEPSSYLVKGFVAHNCVAAIATASTISELAIGKTLDEALKLTKNDVEEKLGGLPPEKMHCSVLSQQGLKAAIEDYRKKKAG